MTTPRLHIDLDALAQNFHRLRQRGAVSVDPHRAAAVVKANAYGFGIEVVAKRLWQEGCRRFFVALADEGRQLRGLLPDAHIYVLFGPTSDTLATLLSEELIPVLNTPEQCERWSNASATGLAALHLDTGMHRLGIAVDHDFDTLPPLQIELIMTHYARADEYENPMRDQQRSRMEVCFTKLQNRFPKALISLNNSAGVLADQVTLSAAEVVTCAPQVDRLGIALYGVNPHVPPTSAPAAVPMATVATLQGQVLQVRRVSAGARVGYGSTYQVTEAGRLATIGIGYADGVSRLLSNRGDVVFQGMRLPIVGRISMDSLVVELTDTMAADCLIAEGDWVEVFGPNLPVEEVAEHAQTIAYEVFTGLGSRVHRLPQCGGEPSGSRS